MQNREHAADMPADPIASVLGIIGIAVSNQAAEPDQVTLHKMQRLYLQSAEQVFRDPALSQRQREVAACAAASVVYFEQSDMRIEERRLRKVARTTNQLLRPMLIIMGATGLELPARWLRPITTPLIVSHREQPQQELAFAPTDALRWLVQPQQLKTQPQLRAAFTMLREDYPIDNS